MTIPILDRPAWTEATDEQPCPVCDNSGECLSHPGGKLIACTGTSTVTFNGWRRLSADEGSTFRQMYASTCYTLYRSPDAKTIPADLKWPGIAPNFRRWMERQYPHCTGQILIDNRPPKIVQPDQALLDLFQEAESALKKWGLSHDDNHSLTEWANFIETYLMRIDHAAIEKDRMAARHTFIQISGLALNAVRAIDRTTVPIEKTDEPTKEEGS